MLQYHQTTPLIELEKLSAATNGKARIFAVMAPDGNIKKIPAAYMFKKAKQSGVLKGKHTIIEASSGNMACALCTIAKENDMRFIAVIRNDTARGKKEELNMRDAKIVYENDLSEGVTPIKYAREEGKREGFLNFCQYENLDNPESYERWFAPQILKELGRRNLLKNPLVFCAGIGTGGTITGCGRFFKHRYFDSRIIGTILAPGERVPGVRDPERLKEVEIKWQDVIDGEAIQIKRYDAYLRSLELVKMDLDAGPSSGLALAGLLEYLKVFEKREQLVAVFVCPDSYKSYSDKYETILDGREFARTPPFGI